MPSLQSLGLPGQSNPEFRYEMKTARFKPGEVVPENGVYRAEHQRHRLMHTATLPAASRFPRCKQCGDAVDYFLLRPVTGRHVLPLRSGVFLQEFTQMVQARGLDF